MSVRGEFRRLAGDLIGVYRDAGRARDEGVRALEPLIERSREDLSGAAKEALVLLARLDGASLSDADLSQRFRDAHERLDAVCRIILGRSA